VKSLPRAVLMIGATSLVLTACSTGTPAPAPGPGQPADPAQAVRVIEVAAGDDLRFDPFAITVQTGETITFRVANAGNVPHDFTLGDEAMQQEHEEEMLEIGGMSMPDEPNAVVLAPGDTKDLTWTFTEPGTVLIGCHQPGHYSAGMKGTVTVEG